MKLFGMTEDQIWTPKVFLTYKGLCKLQACSDSRWDWKDLFWHSKQEVTEELLECFSDLEPNVWLSPSTKSIGPYNGWNWGDRYNIYARRGILYLDPRRQATYLRAWIIKNGVKQ